LRLLLILSRDLPNANAEQENSGAEHRDSQAAKPVKHHLDGFLSTLRFPFREGAISRRFHYSWSGANNERPILADVGGAN
jgi:hypothetical protein